LPRKALRKKEGERKKGGGDCDSAHHPLSAASLSLHAGSGGRGKGENAPAALPCLYATVFLGGTLAREKRGKGKRKRGAEVPLLLLPLLNPLRAECTAIASWAAEKKKRGKREGGREKASRPHFKVPC